MSKTRRQDKRALEVTKSVTADLEVVRNEERLGGVITQKENEELFFIDTRGKDAPSNPLMKAPVKRTLKIDQILKPESAYTIGRSHQTKGNKTEEMMIAKKTKALANTPSIKPTAVKTAKPAVYDAWADENDTVAPVVPSKKSKFVPVIPAVQVPEAAVSYNPSRDEHLLHLQSLEAKELERLARNEAFKTRLPLQECSSETVAKSDLVAIANRKLATGEVSDNEEDEEAAELFLGASTQVNRKKTLQDRKRQLRHKELTAEQQARRKEKLLHASIDKAPALMAQIQSVQQTRQEAEALLAPIEKEIEQQRKVNKLKKRLVLEPLAIKLPEELPSSMRQLAPEGNLVTDRFRNLIERGVVEATTHKILSTEVKSNNRKQGKSLKPRIKMVEKFSYKDFK